MPKHGGKLRNALDRHQGRDYKPEHQKKLQKQAEKRKRERRARQEANGASEEDSDVAVDGRTADEGKDSIVRKNATEDTDDDVWESFDDEQTSDKEPGAVQQDSPGEGAEDEDEDEEDEATFVTARFEDSDSSSASELDDAPADPADPASDDDNASDIPLSDIASLSSTERADVTPHQRLTINNTTALTKSLRSFALPLARLPFSEHQSHTSDAPTALADVDDDLARELAFYGQSLAAVREARGRLRREGAPFARPADYFAEMVKSDAHMGRVKQKLVDAAAGKRAAADARRQRDLKRFGKQVQVEKLQARDKAKRETLDKINLLKRKRRDADDPTAQEDDLFDVALEDAAATAPARGDRGTGARRGARGASRGGNSNVKRQKKDERHGFGGKKRFAKSGDAVSSADMRDFSARRMKGGQQGRGGKKTGPPRLGKSRRANRA